MATVAAGALMSNPLVQKVGKNIVGKVADKASQGILGGIGGAIGGKKGKRIGKTIAKGLSSVRKGIFGFESGGKIRKVPMVVTGYSAGGAIMKPVPGVRHLPASNPRGRRRK